MPVVCFNSAKERVNAYYQDFQRPQVVKRILFMHTPMQLQCHLAGEQQTQTAKDSDVEEKQQR